MTARARTTILSAATALAATAFLTPTAAAVDGPDRIIDGSTSTETKGAVAMLTDGSTAAGQANCSGSLLTETKVLTAAHCFSPTQTGVVFRVGSLSWSSGGTVHKVADVATQHDVAVVTLATPATGAETVELATEDPAIREKNQIRGWGVTETGDGSPVLKQASVRVLEVDATDALGGPAINSVGIDGSAGSGDSGGPQFGADGTQVGVCSTGGFGYQQYSSVAANLKFIRAHAGL